MCLMMVVCGCWPIFFKAIMTVMVKQEQLTAMSVQHLNVWSISSFIRNHVGHSIKQGTSLRNMKKRAYWRSNKLVSNRRSPWTKYTISVVKSMDTPNITDIWQKHHLRIHLPINALYLFIFYRVQYLFDECILCYNIVYTDVYNIPLNKQYL